MDVKPSTSKILMASIVSTENIFKNQTVDLKIYIHVYYEIII